LQKDDRQLMKEGLEQLAEKQIQDIDRMLVKRMGVDSTNSLERDNDNTFADLFSRMPMSGSDNASPTERKGTKNDG
jgi:hypothetical protein